MPQPQNHKLFALQYKKACLDSAEWIHHHTGAHYGAEE